ncbi:MAG: NAD-dependent epimerase/dehydratase family protein [Acidobacteria bacterium]|nr:NAD-dependent epimerase/dehydratase family protein [Acidobacteriota bacterium]
MRVLVTGAQGCIGTWVVKVLLERGVDVMAFDFDPAPVRLTKIIPAHLLVRLPVEVGRIEDTARVKKLVKEAGITHIIHLAAMLMPFCQASPVEGGMINVIGTLNVFEAARDAGRPVRVVYASSSAVWGPEEVYGAGKLTEDDPLRPSTHYGVFKQANEGNARAFYAANGISSVGLRPWTVYGPGRDRGLTADPTLAMEAVVRGVPFQIRVSGYMDLQYVEDVAEIFVRCLLSSLEGAHVFNLAGSVVGMQELIDTLERLRPGANRLITASGPQVPVAYRMDDSELRAKVGGIPKTVLEEGIGRTLGFFERLRANS